MPIDTKPPAPSLQCLPARDSGWSVRKFGRFYAISGNGGAKGRPASIAEIDVAAHLPNVVSALNKAHQLRSVDAPDRYLAGIIAADEAVQETDVLFREPEGSFHLDYSQATTLSTQQDELSHNVKMELSISARAESISLIRFTAEG
jgi:hypothetical protein